MTREQALNFLLNRPADFGKLLGFTKLGPLHNKWIIDMVRGQKDKTLQASRGTYKTTCVSIALALICILQKKKKTMFMRKTDADVKEVIKQVQKILLDSHTQYIINCIYGVNLVLNVQSATEVNTNLSTDNKGTSQLIGVGTGGSLTGKHFDRIFTDDIVNVQDRISKAERDKTKTIYQELQNIKNRDGRIFNTGTPWHKEDCFTIMPEAEKFNCYHPEIQKIISKQELDEVRAKMTPSLFAANYELRHVASDDVLFTSPQTGADISLVEQGTGHIDAAYYGEDYTAYTVINLHDGKYYVYGKLWRKHIDDVLDTILEIHHGLKAGKIYCEENGDKGYLGRDLRKRGERVVIYTESMNKYLKITSFLKFEWENVIFVKGTDTEYINQICDFNDNAEHDDAPDSLASMIRAIPNKPRKTNTLNLFGGLK